MHSLSLFKTCTTVSLSIFYLLFFLSKLFYILSVLINYYKTVNVILHWYVYIFLLLSIILFFTSSWNYNYVYIYLLILLENPVPHILNIHLPYQLRIWHNFTLHYYLKLMILTFMVFGGVIKDLISTFSHYRVLNRNHVVRKCRTKFRLSYWHLCFYWSYVLVQERIHRVGIWHLVNGFNFFFLWWI